MYNVMILEDDLGSATYLEQLLMDHPRASEFHVSLARNARALDMYLMRGFQPHILLADIMLPNGPSGIEAVRSRFSRNDGTQVIFVSGLIENALDVFDVNHTSFLLKPVEPEKLNHAIDRAIENLESLDSGKSFIQLCVHNQVKYIATDTIRYIQSNLRLATLHTTLGVISEYSKLDDLMEQLPNNFARCHRSTIVNMDHIVSLDAESVTIDDGTSHPISRSRSKEVSRAFLSRIS